MRKDVQIFGYILFLAGVFLFGMIHLAFAIYVPHLTGWGDPPGKLATILDQINGLAPYFLGISFMIIGGIIILFNLFKQYFL
ncbi:hypothetical protein M3589_25775 [Heyndrickxia oleronia]|uniref:hypothetical protein n=1 Tax=Heyndrickxia oleronia TaxID=38875 RepID=UPI002040FBD9|nr:hypothetical protein [Heyndrickxia oleronia]MCM3241064.1 hypothetical protein [Heyndrickxia oleronia]